MQLLNRKFIYVNAAQCSQVSNGQFTFSIPQNFLSIHPDDITKLYISEMFVSYSFDAINSQNNLITINNVKYILPDGSPTVLDLLNYLNSLTSQTQISVTFNSYNGRFVFQNNSSNPVTIDMTNSDSCTKQLGLTNQLYTIAGNGTLTSTQQVDVSASNVIIVRGSLHTGNYEVTYGESIESDVLCVIPMNVPPYGLATYSDYRGQKAFICQAKSKLDITITLFDQYGDNVVPAQPPYLVLACETYRDTTSQLIQLQKQHVDLSKLQLMSLA